MNDINIDYNVYTPISVNLTSFDFTGISKVVMTIKNKPSSDPVLVWEFTESQVYIMDVTPEQSKLIHTTAEYDIDIITTGGKRYKNADNGKIHLRFGCGTVEDSIGDDS